MGVEPWDRDILAKDEMRLTTDALEAAAAGSSHLAVSINWVSAPVAPKNTMTCTSV